MHIFLVILFFEFMILSHEMGHFLVGKFFKVAVKEFSIGFGPTVLKKEKNKTNYCLRLFPLGGFVCFDDEEFVKKSIFKRMIIFLAGPFSNFIFAIFSISCLLFIQGSFNSTEVGFVDEFCTQFKVGDEIKKVNGHKVFSADDFIYNIKKAPLNEPINVVVKRNGKKIELLDVAKKSKNFEKDKGKIGITLKVKSLNFFNFFEQIFNTFIFIIKLILTSFARCVMSFSFKEVSGPIGVINAFKETAKVGVKSMLSFFAFLSINLGIFNLFPIPALDGGQILFLIIEYILKRPIKKEVSVFLTRFGLMFIFFFSFVVCLKDIFFNFF